MVTQFAALLQPAVLWIAVCLLMFSVNASAIKTLWISAFIALWWIEATPARCTGHLYTASLAKWMWMSTMPASGLKVSYTMTLTQLLSFRYQGEIHILISYNTVSLDWDLWDIRFCSFDRVGTPRNPRTSPLLASPIGLWISPLN